MKRLLIVLLLLVCTNAYAQTTDLYNHAIEEVKGLIAAGKYEKAFQQLTILNEREDGDKTEILALMADISSKQIENFKKIIAKGNDNSGKDNETILYPLYINSEPSETLLPITSSWTVANSLDWCDASLRGDTLALKVTKNVGRESRSGEIVLSKISTGRKMHISINQTGRAAAVKTVFFRTMPNNVNITLENGQTYNSFSTKIAIEEGKCSATVSKSKYYSQTVHFSVENDEEKELTVTVPPLKRQFGVVQVDVTTDSQFELDTKQTLVISKKTGMNESRTLSLNTYTLKSLDDSDVEYYKIYPGNLIPLEPGTYDFTLDSPNFKSISETDVVVGEDEDIKLNLNLLPKQGYLTLRNAKNANGAKVIVDGHLIGTVPVQRCPIKVGTHTVEFEKEGFISPEKSYTIDISEGDEWPIEVELYKYVIYSISSDPTRAEVELDGVFKGFTPLTMKVTEGTHNLDVAYEDRFTERRSLKVDADSQSDSLSFALREAGSLYVATDGTALQDNAYTMRIRQGNTVYASNESVPATLNLPISSKKYTIELWDLGNKRNTVVNRRGMRRCRISDESQTQTKISTYSVNDFKTLDLNFFYPFPEIQQSLGGECTYSKVGSLSYLKFKLMKGLSSGMAKATIFLLQETHQEQIQLEGYETVDFPSVLPAVSCALINEEFRVGGALFHHGDISLMGSYTWYPPLTFISSFNHVSGHDFFVGPELSTRTKRVNMYVRAGFSIFKGEANYYLTKSSYSKKGEYVKCSMDKTEFVLSMGLTLGDTDSKGNNILRLF